MINRPCIKVIVALSILLVYSVVATGQSIRTEFGKNRVQYHDDFNKWWMYETENFVVYWYGKGRNIAQSAVQIAEFIHPNIQNFVEHRINDKIEIIVYTDVSDLLQSNIGNEETFETKHEVTKVIGSRLFVFFDGNHRNLEDDLRKGITQVYLNAMYAQAGLQSIIDSDPDLNLPEWYNDGFVSYSKARWDSEIEDELRDLWSLKGDKYHKFDRLANDYPRVAGHAMWHFIAEEYGRTSLTTSLYLEKDVFEDFQEEDLISTGYKKWFPKSALELSPDGSHLIYVVNEYGKYSVILRDISSGDQDVIFRHGSKNQVQQADYNYPLIAWHPDKPEVTICYEFRDLIILRRVDLVSGQTWEESVPENFRRIYNFDYISDDRYMFNGTTDGYSDLYVYRFISRQHDQITEDFYDDIDASYVQLGDQWGVLFASNRPSSEIFIQRLDTILPTGHFDIFFLPDGSDYALNLTNTPDESEMSPRLLDNHYISFLKNTNGINNRWTQDLNGRRPPYPSTNLSRNIINHEASLHLSNNQKM